MTNLSTSASTSFRGRRFVGRLVAAVLLLIVLVAGVWLEREALLQGAADLWTVSDPVTPSDVVVVLPDDDRRLTRLFVAAELYKKGLVTKVLVSRVSAKRHERLLAIPGGSEFDRVMLQRLAVPDADIETFGQGNVNMKEQAVALRDWANGHDISSMVIATELFASRRTRRTFNRAFSGSSVRVKVLAFEPDYTRADWWKTDEGMIAFDKEVMKYLYYRFKY